MTAQDHSITMPSNYMIVAAQTLGFQRATRIRNPSKELPWQHASERVFIKTEGTLRTSESILNTRYNYIDKVGKFKLFSNIHDCMDDQVVTQCFIFIFIDMGSFIPEEDKPVFQKFLQDVKLHSLALHSRHTPHLRLSESLLPQPPPHPLPHSQPRHHKVKVHKNSARRDTIEMTR